MWTKYLLSGIVSSLLFLFASCGKDKVRIDYDFTFEYIYENRLDVPVRVEYHWTEYKDGVPPTEKRKTVNLAVGETFVEATGSSHYRSTPVMIHCDSVRFVFNDAKELWYHWPDGVTEEGSVHNPKNYTKKKVSEWECIYTFEISQKIYDLAAAIE